MSYPASHTPEARDGVEALLAQIAVSVGAITDDASSVEDKLAAIAVALAAAAATETGSGSLPYPTYHTTSATVAEPGATFYMTGLADATCTAPTPRNGGCCEVSVFYETGATQGFSLTYLSGLGVITIAYNTLPGYLRVLTLRGVNNRWILHEQLLELVSS